MVSLRGNFGLTAAVVSRFSDLYRYWLIKSGDKGGRFRSSSSKIPLHDLLPSQKTENRKREGGQGPLRGALGDTYNWSFLGRIMRVR